MNNRIAELECQCWEDKSQEWAENVKMVFNTTRFAEMVVQECAKVQAERSSARHGYDKHEDGPAILRYFGVEPKTDASLNEFHTHGTKPNGSTSTL